MRHSNPKFSFDPGFSALKKILILVVLGCFLVFFGLVYAGEEVDPDTPFGEHPWDDLRSESDHQPPHDIGNVIIFPCGDFGGWIIIHLTQSKDGDIEKDGVQIQTSDKNQGQSFILF